MFFLISRDDEESISLISREDEESMYLGFEPGAIHKQEFRPFWKDVLKADEWVLNTLELGYMIPFLSTPTQYEEQNKYIFICWQK